MEQRIARSGASLRAKPNLGASAKKDILSLLDELFKFDLKTIIPEDAQPQDFTLAAMNFAKESNSFVESDEIMTWQQYLLATNQKSIQGDGKDLGEQIPFEKESNTVFIQWMNDPVNLENTGDFPSDSYQLGDLFGLEYIIILPFNDLFRSNFEENVSELENKNEIMKRMEMTHERFSYWWYFDDKPLYLYPEIWNWIIDPIKELEQRKFFFSTEIFSVNLKTVTASHIEFINQSSNQTETLAVFTRLIKRVGVVSN